MKNDIGKSFLWKNEQIEIINAFSCYDGDFYEYVKLPRLKALFKKEEIFRINIHTTEGAEFIRHIP